MKKEIDNKEVNARKNVFFDIERLFYSFLFLDQKDNLLFLIIFIKVCFFKLLV